MADLMTNRGRRLLLESYFNAVTPTNFYCALVTSAATPTVDTNTLSELTEIAAGNGYTSGGIQLTRNTTDFPSITENDSSDLASIGVKDMVWTASGGSLPASGGGARWMVLTTDEATVGNRQIIAAFDLASDRTVSSGQTLTVSGMTLRAKLS